ncbi:sulfatase [Spirillospora sp. NPDC047279]|uniref:sulfatase n=1 Tax=Spirillospora sp. NPDC047279 TaxID=3155478 RepID=UPI0033D37604
MRTALSWTVTTLAALLVLFVLLMPVTIARLTPGSFVRIPLEAIAGVGLVLVLRDRARRPWAILAGVGLGLLFILKLLDMGFRETLARPFNPVLDWTFVGAGLEFANSTFGRVGSIGAVVLTVLLIVGVLALMVLSARRLSRVIVAHTTVSATGVAVAGTAWFVCAALGAHLVPGTTVATMGSSKLALGRVSKVSESLKDDRAFIRAVGVDAFRDTPGDQLLAGLRGKDVVLTFVESYGRTVSETPEIRSLTADGTRRLRAAGFESRSAFLKSPTAGGGSWLAHSTLLSGLWVDNQKRYGKLVSTDRLTLNRAFQRAGWRSVGVMPGVVRSWPEGEFFGYDKVYTAKDLGYRGPYFGWSTMPDQYTLEQFQRLERGRPGRGPLMAEIPLLSSHAPWAPIPKKVEWNQLGDGSLFNAVQAAAPKREDVWTSPGRIRTEYRRSVEYSLETLISYVEKYGDDKLVLIFLGDHQPIPVATGNDPSRDVPITIVSRDTKVLDRVASLSWQEGLLASDGAPVWPMNAFRDRFLTAFAR